MKNAIIFHGTDSNPDRSWYKWLAGKLEARGYKVAVPHYPDINKAPVEDLLSRVLKDHKFDSETVLIGHSSGAALLLSLLENIEPQIVQAVLVAGYSEQLPVHQPIIQDSYDWAKIKAHARDFVFINSQNDPWGCDDKQGYKMLEKLGGELVIKNDGHFSTSGDPKYKEFPLLERLIGVNE
jgi:predicted alpha/beta hydrolase family esterase